MPKKSLGQHFLVNRSAINKIVASLNLEKNDTVIEIGPGEGALTIPLAEECARIGCRLIAIEKDQRLADELKSLKVEKLEVTTGDALKTLKLTTSQLKTYKLVGNIPYYITGKLLRTLGELETKPSLIVLTIQREVAERVVAKPPKMNLLAAATQIWAEVEIMGRLGPKDFNPPPKVDSAIIKLTPNLRSCDDLKLEEYYRLIKLIFQQPRKTVLNNLSTPFDKLRASPNKLRASPNKLGVKATRSKEEILKILQKVGLTGQERPQNLDLATLTKLSTLIRGRSLSQ